MIKAGIDANASYTAAAATAGTGRGNYQGRNPRNRNQQNARRTTTAPAFKVSVKEMNGHVFQCYGETSNKNQFNQTVEELDGYIRINLKHSEDVKKMVKKMKDTVIAMPVDLKDDASKTELKIWDKMIEIYVEEYS